MKLAFDFARAAAALLAASHQSATGQSVKLPQPAALGAANGADPTLEQLQARRAQVQASHDRLAEQLKQLRGDLASAPRSARDALRHKALTLQAQIGLAQSHLDSIDAMIAFETTKATGSSAGLETQIDELERSAPAATAVSASSMAFAPMPSAGLLGRAEAILAIDRKARNLALAITLSQNLRNEDLALRAPLLERLAQLDSLGLAQTGGAGDENADTLKQTQAEIDQLTRRGKLLSAASLPLSKQAVLLDLYVGSLTRWRDAVRQQFNDALRGLIIRAAAFALILVAIFVAAALWRRLTFRYVQDPQRRAQLLQLRRLLVIVAIALLTLLAFASQLGALATVMGLAAAGIALALQNVILSMAGYFYLSGRFGLRVGDRVQIAGITGDVLESGFFKLTLMELAGDDSGREPTGRAVIFPNSVVFQPNSNFYRQLPGTTFAWQELRLSLAPDCDYRVAEQRLTEVVNDVFARDRDRIQSEYRLAEKELAIRIDTPRPNARLYLGSNGLEIVIRYPARLTGAVRTADEITRRLLDTIKREPGLRIATAGIPTIQNDLAPPVEPVADAAAKS
ncbi:MAG TPA: mechanosensitive ion channel family protein [Candidatus Binataceae bacterium]|nr:mechanosensitive ion channel family protein [Candidatus Binataceae bacterium]